MRIAADEWDAFHQCLRHQEPVKRRGQKGDIQDFHNLENLVCPLFSPNILYVPFFRRDEAARSVCEPFPCSDMLVLVRS